MKLSISHKGYFSAAHRLHNPAWSDEKNRAVFDKCNNPNYHGHNYKLIVALSGSLHSDTEHMLNHKKLGELVSRHVIQRFDYKNLNLDVVLFRKLNPTAENIAITIWKLLRPHIQEKYDLKITLYETEKNFVEYPVS